MAAERSTQHVDVLYLVTSSVSTRFLVDQLRFLSDRGVRVSIGTKPEPADPATGHVRTLDGVGLHAVPFEREPSPRADAVALWRLVRLLRELRPRVVNAATPKAGLLGMLAARACRVPCRVYVVWGLRFETMEGTRRRVFRWLERLATSSATHVLYNSRSLMDVAVRERTVRPSRARPLGHGGGNCVCMSQFDDLPDRRAARSGLGLPDDAVVVGFVGRLTRDKGIVDLVALFTDDDIDDRAQLLLVGEFESGDPVPPNTREHIERSPNITHVPWLDDPRAAYAAMDLLAFASYREGLPNVPMEAQRSGVPVIGYAATGTVDAVRHDVGGRLVATGDVAALHREIRALIADTDRRREFGEAGRRFVVEEFAPERCWQHLLDLYTDATG